MTQELKERATRTADYHARMAANWECKESLASFAGNDDDVEKCHRQRQSHLDAADTIRTIIKLLSRRPDSRTFVPPTVEQVFAFSREHHDIKGRWPIADIKAWWRHFQSVGWLIGKGKKMKDWEAAALNGFKSWADKNPNRSNGNGKDEEPKGWAEYLKSIGLPLAPYKYAPEHLKTDFRKGTD